MNIWCYAIVFSCFCGCVIHSQSTSCTTPNGEKAFCTSLFDCALLQNAYIKTPQEVRLFIEASKCPEGNFTVCCGTFSNFLFNRIQETPGGVKKKTNFLPSKTYCGKQHTDDYFYTGNDTSVDEFPWMVYIVSKDQYLNSNNKFEGNVGVGVIISNKYILSVKRNYSTSFVRIGQHHILKESSCIRTEYGDDCTNPALVISVEKFYVRPESTIALLRLNTTIIYSDYVRPICLPFKKFNSPNISDTIVVSGWGAERFVDGLKLQVKKRLKHTVISQELCVKGNPIPNPICGAIFRNSTIFVCPQDNGGPIMYKFRTNWIVVGIVSGTTACVKHQPVSGERITQETIDWIKENLEP